jgi:RNA polymerase sigma-70 factor (ECF subfamily)
LDAWIATVALNLSRSGIRRRIAERRAHTRMRASLPDVVEDPDTVDVQRALAALPRRQRQVAVLRYVLELDTAETAAVLRIGEGTVKSSLAKARAHLAESLRMQDVEVTERAEP